MCDIDGTLAWHQGRDPYAEELCETDLLNDEVARILALCDRAQDHIILLSGRSTNVQEQTERWL
jgi:hypothetical protein